MLGKTVIGILLALMFYSLGSALYYLYADRGRGTRTVRALTMRIALWIVLFALLYLGMATGVITPSNSLRPTTGAGSQGTSE
jgi:predicted permease